jgi:hypothetical protein
LELILPTKRKGKKVGEILGVSSRYSLGKVEDT